MNGSRVCVIAEAGVNHNGSLERALRMVEIAAECGADVVKFQTFRADALATRAAPKAEYQIRAEGGDSQFEMLRRLELDDDAHRRLLGHCRTVGIGFLSTPFDLDSTRYLITDLALPSLKISSGDLTNGPLLLAAARGGCDVILSTGMATLAEVEEALGVLAFGYLDDQNAPAAAAFAAAGRSEAGRAALRRKVVLLHCTTEYPTPYEDVNLRAMATLAERFGLAVGYSDHTPGIAVAVAAVALGAAVIEKHFTLDRALPGPDHAASLEPAELRDMVRAVRAVETALGSAEKKPAPSESRNMAVARKSLVAARPIRKGEVLTVEAMLAKRPGTGISPMRLWDVAGRPAGRDYAPDEAIEW